MTNPIPAEEWERVVDDIESVRDTLAATGVGDLAGRLGRALRRLTVIRARGWTGEPDVVVAPTKRGRREVA